MTRSRYQGLALLLALAVLLRVREAFADPTLDAAGPVDTGADEDAGAASSSQSDNTPLACDGSLCDTTTGSLCDVSHVDAGTAPPGVLLATAAAALAMLARRRRPPVEAARVASSSKKESFR